MKMAKTAHIFTPLTDSDSVASFRSGVEDAIQNLLTEGVLMSNIECQYQQSDKYISCLIVVRG
jgi:hypothetical protein